MTTRKPTQKGRGKRAQTIRVTTSGKPPLSAAGAFASLLAKVKTVRR